jgi:hypothetical protein
MDQDSFIPTTVRNHLERNGAAMAEEIKAKAEKALVDANFVPGLPIDQERQALFDDKSFFVDPIVVAEAAETNGIPDYNQTDYEAQPMTINISVDDIGVTRQNPARPMEKDATKSKYVEHVVVHFQGKDGERMSDGQAWHKHWVSCPVSWPSTACCMTPPRLFHRWGQMHT